MEVVTFDLTSNSSSVRAYTQEELDTLAAQATKLAQEAKMRRRVSRFQGRAALMQLNKLSDVTAYMAQPTTPEIVKEAWASVQEFRRMSLMIMNVAIILGWSDEELDHLFEVAEAIGEV